MDLTAKVRLASNPLAADSSAFKSLSFATSKGSSIFIVYLGLGTLTDRSFVAKRRPQLFDRLRLALPADC